ncbi:elicitor-responsive protein 1-like [Nymphaea colorata]|nr:elicitor-responsive protein 1-like [Nymphaea colorata]
MVRGILEVLLVDAKGLHNTEFLAKMDPYVVIQCRNYERKSNIAKDQGSNPVWNEKISFPVQLPCVDDQLKLVLRILDKDTFSSDDFVGETTIHLKELITEGEENGVAEIKPCSYAVVLADRTYCGKIQIGVKFTLKEV